MVSTARIQQLSPARAAGMERPVSLSEVLDRVLNKGVVVAGEIVISIAGIDLVYLGLNVVLTSVDGLRKQTAEMEGSNGVHENK